ncbi:MAG: dienelactone hydrolase family protein [Acidimicrobiales bacterium]
MGEAVSFPSAGTTIRGYVATGEGAGLGLIVLAPHLPEVCDRLAAEGFTALTPGISQEMGRASQDLSATVDYLVAHPSVRGHGLGVIGFGEGGGQALWLGTLRPDQVRAVVPFYGIPSSGMPPDWDRLEAAVEGHYGEKDDSPSPDAAVALQEALEARRKEVRLFTYPGVGHAFFDNARPDAYDEDAAHLAWVRTLEFLRAKLG